MNTNPYAEENRQGRTMSEIRTPWPDYDPRCESWAEGGFHPMIPQGFFGPLEFRGEDIEGRLKVAVAQITDDHLTLRFREEVRHRIERYQSWLRQLRGEPDAIPEGAGKAYKEWVVELRKVCK